MTVDEKQYNENIVAPSSTTNDLVLAKQEIMRFIELCPDASFVEIERLLKDENLIKNSEEKVSIFHHKFKNLIIWITNNNLLVDSISGLQKEIKLQVKPCSPWLYALDGQLLTLPIAKKIMDYKKPHWLPVAISLHPLQKLIKKNSNNTNC